MQIAKFHTGIATKGRYIDEFLIRSLIPTNHFQKSLPRLPVPNLESTCKRYLKSQESFLPAEEFRITEKIAHEFSNGIGIKLQKLLIDYDNSRPNESYISDMWFSYYLNDRKPLALNANPFISIKDDPKSKYNDQILRATNMVISALRFKNSYDRNILEPDIFHLKPHFSNTILYNWLCRLTPRQFSFYTSYLFSAYPLDMSQYRNLFCSTRIPKLGRDELYQESIDRPKLLVSVEGKLYLVSLHDKTGSVLPPNVIYAILHYVYNTNTYTTQEDINNQRQQFNIGVLTAIADRNQWAAFRDDMIVFSEKNYGALQLIDTAFFVLCLDKTKANSDTLSKLSDLKSQTQKTHDVKAGLELARQFLLAPKESLFLNRWFDKSFQLILTPEGKCAVNLEHSWGDGVSIVRFLADIFVDTVSRPALHPAQATGEALAFEDFVQPIYFDLNEDLQKRLELFKQKMIAVNNNLQMGATSNSKLTKYYFKDCGLSADAMMQLAIQMANDRILERPSATYESCSTAAFKKGRTETIRSATMATKEFCQTLRQSLNPTSNISDDLLRDLIKLCSKTHSILTREAAMGQGWDRHLFALKHMATRELERVDNRLTEVANSNVPTKNEGRGIAKDIITEMPAIFTDPSYAKINRIVLSTSTVDSPVVETGGFGPVCPEGLGIGYGIDRERAGLLVTSYQSPELGKTRPLNANTFISAVEESFEKLYNLVKPLAKNNPPSPPKTK